MTSTREARGGAEESLAGLLNATSEFIEASTTDEVAAATVDAARGVLGLSLSGVHLHDETSDCLELAALSNDARELLDPERMDYGRGDHLVWETYEGGEPTVVDDLRTVGDRLPNPETPVRSALIMPLPDHGVFIASSTTLKRFDETDVRLASLLANATTSALDRVAAHEAMSRRRERLEEFADVLAHDVRTPLSAGKNWTELADVSDPDERAYALEHARGAFDRIEGLVDSLRSLARVQTPVETRESLALEPVVRETWSMATATATADMNLSVETDLGTIRADEPRLRQLLENLFGNALEHAATDDGLIVSVGSLEDGGFYIADDGPGVPAETRETVFEYGYSGAGGSGFGLAIVTGVAEAHDWTVALTESEASGARFEIRF